MTDKDNRMAGGQGLGTCLYCGNWTSKARGNAAGEHWCRHLHTWTPPGFACQAHADIPLSDEILEGYTVEEIAAKCHVYTSTVRYWIMTGRLKAVLVNNDAVKLAGQFATSWRIDKTCADRYVEWYLSLMEK